MKNHFLLFLIIFSFNSFAKKVCYKPRQMTKLVYCGDIFSNKKLVNSLGIKFSRNEYLFKEKALATNVLNMIRINLSLPSNSQKKYCISFKPGAPQSEGFSLE